MAYLYRPRLSTERERLPELYYEAARLNGNIVRLFDFARNRSEIVKQNEVGTSYQFGPRFLSSFRKIITMNFDILSRPEEIELDENGRRKSTHRECVVHIIDKISVIGELIDYFFENEPPLKQFLFSPQLIGFVALFEQFPNASWNQLPAEEKKLGQSLFHFYDDGPVPAFQRLNQEYQQKLEDFREVHSMYNTQGRKLSFECAVIDWAYSDKEIVKEISKWIKINRPSGIKGTKDAWIDKSSYYRDIEMGATPSTILAILTLYHEVLSGMFGNSWNTMVNASDHDPSKPFKSYSATKKSKFIESIRNWISGTGHLPEGTNYTKRPLDLDCLVHLVNTGFNLPAQFQSAKDASKISATSIFYSSNPNQNSDFG